MPERIVRPGILSSDAVNALTWAEEVFYRRLMSVVDDFGRFDGRNQVLRASLYPLKLNHVSDSDVAKLKAGCASAGLVRIYFVDNKEFIEIYKFDQRMRGKPRWPAPNDGESPQLAATRGECPPSSYAETETETHTASDKPPAGKTRIGVEDIYDAYPRKVGRKAALKKIEVALSELRDTHGDNGPVWLLARVKAFASSPAGRAGEFTPHCATWMHQGRYDDDEEQWQRGGGDDNPDELEGGFVRRVPTEADVSAVMGGGE
jgi:hypothetical protein